MSTTIAGTLFGELRRNKAFIRRTLSPSPTRPQTVAGMRCSPIPCHGDSWLDHQFASAFLSFGNQKHFSESHWTCSRGGLQGRLGDACWYLGPPFRGSASLWLSEPHSGAQIPVISLRIRASLVLRPALADSSIRIFCAARSSLDRLQVDCLAFASGAMTFCIIIFKHLTDSYIIFISLYCVLYYIYMFIFGFMISTLYYQCRAECCWSICLGRCLTKEPHGWSVRLGRWTWGWTPTHRIKAFRPCWNSC